jgi:hypothetical protein
MQRFGNIGLAFGFSAKAIHDILGVEFDQTYYFDIAHRVATNLEIDRQIYDLYHEIGIGFNEPFPRVTIEPFGHRFIPAMYGCQCHYSKDSEPWGEVNPLNDEEISSLKHWTFERLEKSEPVQRVISQYRYLIQNYPLPDQKLFGEFNPHYRVWSSIQNLGSVINNAFSIQGNEFLMNYLIHPNLVNLLYKNILQLMLLCLEFFPRIDSSPLKNIFIGNCTVAMISPKQYLNINYPYDLKIMEFARLKGANFLIHQDSGVSPHLENYASFEYLHALDFGQDTNFERLVKLFPHTSLNCILFPNWIYEASCEEISEQLLQIMTIAKNLPSLSFTLYEIDTLLTKEKIFSLYEIFTKCVEKISL